MPMIVEEGKVISINGIARDVTRNILDQEEKLNLEAKLRQAIKMQAVGSIYDELLLQCRLGDEGKRNNLSPP